MSVESEYRYPAWEGESRRVLTPLPYIMKPAERCVSVVNSNILVKDTEV